MGRLTADMVPLLDSMVAARKGVRRGKKIGGTELAKIVGISWRILRRRIEDDAEFPVLERGADGKKWLFDTAVALDRLIATTKALKEQRRRRGAEGARLSGMAGVRPSRKVKAEPEPELPENAADLAQNARALKALAETQMLVQRLKMQQRELITRREHEEKFEVYSSAVQTGVLAVASKVDPASQFPAELREAIEDHLRTVLVQARTEAEKVTADYVLRHD